MSRGKAAKSLALIWAAREILRQIQPASVRAVCYRLFTLGVITNMSKKETNRVSSQLTWAREENVIPWDHIVDETREVERVNAWENPAAYVETVRRAYRRDRWTDQPERIEVWSEKGTVRGTLAPVLDQYGIAFRVMHGYGSATALHMAAEDSCESEKPLTIFYVGDWDPSGMHMSEIDVPGRLDRYGGNADLERLALTEDDTRSDLPSFLAETKRGDKRYGWYVRTYGDHCWELDALSPVVLRDRVENAILERLDLDAEKCVLGAILVDNDTFAQAAAILQPPDFYRRAHQILFARSATLAAHGQPIDPVTLKHALGDAELEQVGGVAYVCSLTDGLPRRSNIAHHAKIVREHSRRRRLLTVVTEAHRELQAGHTDAAAVRLRDVMSTLDTADDDALGLNAAALDDAVDVAEEGQAIARDGVQYLVDGVVPKYSEVGMLVAYTKVGKSTLGLALAGAVATGQEFLGRATTPVRILIVAAENPREYTAYLARYLAVSRGRVTFYREPLILDPAGLARVVHEVQTGGYGLVLFWSWQTLTAGLVENENDNAGAVRVMQNVMRAARQTAATWIIDAHSGKGEDQSDDADPLRAMRGASAAAGVADFMLSLRYAEGAFSTQRRLSGKGRFVSFQPILMDFDATTGTYAVMGDAQNVVGESVWLQILTMGALDAVPQTAGEIAVRAGLAVEGHVTNTHRRQVRDALRNRPEVALVQQRRYGKKATLYQRLEEAS